LADNFKAMGGKVLSQEAIAPTDVDMHPLLTRIASEKPEFIYFPVFTAAGAQILRQAKETPGLEHTTLLGGGALFSADFIEAAGPAVVGFHVAYPDLSPEAMGKGYPNFVEEYKKAFGEAPISGNHGNAYDAAILATKAIEKVAKTDSAGNLYIGKKALRDAVFATKFDGISGPIACDPYGECGEFHPSVLEYTSADPKTFAIGKNPHLDVLVVGLALLFMLALYLIVQRTRMGTAMRAVAEDREAATLMGINIDKVVVFTFALGGAMAGIAGVFYCMVYKQVYFFMGFTPGLKAFGAAVLGGGIGSIPGAMLGGFFLGMVESVGPSLFLDGLGIPAPYQLRDLIAFTLLIMVLIFRPQGIFGERMAKRRA
jgi:Branched-chain amino acid transport system / permease component/Periplasmic binding protein